MKLIIWLSLFVHLSSFVFAHTTDRFHTHLGSGIAISCSNWDHRSDCDRTYPTLPLQSYDHEHDAESATNCCSKYCYYLNGRACLRETCVFGVCFGCADYLYFVTTQITWRDIRDGEYVIQSYNNDRDWLDAKYHCTVAWCEGCPAGDRNISK